METLNNFKTAILLLTFNRLETTQKVFETIKAIKPMRLYIASDGPRNGIAGEREKVELVRSYLMGNIDWDCEVFTLFRDRNLGCKDAVSDAISWFFDAEEMGIILEDDCLPTHSFFYFCSELLHKYKHDLRVWHIGGVCTIDNKYWMEDYSYYFSYFTHIWGWATWSNRWRHYDKNLRNLDNFQRQNTISTITSNLYLKQFWLHNFKLVKANSIDTWDFQWYFTVWSNSGISVIPKINLVSNIGFGKDSTHTNNEDDKLSNMERFELIGELKHPDLVCRNNFYDKLNEINLFEFNFYRFVRLLLSKFYRIIYDKVHKR